MTTFLKDGAFTSQAPSTFSSAFDGAQRAERRDGLSLMTRRTLRAQRRANRSV